ncbi:MAG: hypothetical protein LBU18_01180 [Treponema sp.]|jgi:hypothetical protein|nr:hypothetical protein [Treponema sp.]
MAQEPVLYSILMSYAGKRRSPYIDIAAFITFLEKYAASISAENPEWKKWASGTAEKFHHELSSLVEAQKCEVDKSRRLVMLDFYAELIRPFYQNTERNAAIPFPDEKSLGTAPRDSECLILNIQENLAGYMQEERNVKVHIVKIVFPADIPPALVPPDAIPRPLLDAALLKIHSFLRSQNNKDFFQRRLLLQMQGRDRLLRDAMNMLEMRPLDCILQIQCAAEFSCLFWAAFCAAVKSELKRKEEFLSSDIAAFQAVYIVEVFSAAFKEMVTKKRERDAALKVLESKLVEPPYLYTMDEIVKFTGPSGRSLLGQYSEEDLKNYLNSKASAPGGGKLAELLIYHDKNGGQLFINKQKVFPLCVRLSGRARNQVIKAVGSRWSRILRDFRREPAMEKDDEFDRLLKKYTAQFAPSLISLLYDKKTFLVQCELDGAAGKAPLASRFFTPEGNLLPMETLLMISRKNLLADTRILLPFWYSVPILLSILAFFKRLRSGGKSSAAPEEDFSDGASHPQENGGQSGAQAIKATASQIIQSLPDKNKNLDAALAGLENRWRTLLDAESKRSLIIDIKSLIRDRLRRTMKLKFNQNITLKIVGDLAASIYAEVPAIKQLGDEASITNYIKLYIAKLLLEDKF